MTEPLSPEAARRQSWKVPMTQDEIDDLDGVYFYDDGYAAADDVQRLLATLDAARAAVPDAAPCRHDARWLEDYTRWVIEMNAARAAVPDARLREQLRVVFHDEYERDLSGDRYYGCQHKNQHRVTWDCEQRVEEVWSALATPTPHPEEDPR